MSILEAEFMAMGGKDRVEQVAKKLTKLEADIVQKFDIIIALEYALGTNVRTIDFDKRFKK
ncbi:MAG: hypothetical protein ACTHKC_09200 [Candidatus Nitrosocosmicus sp.]